MDKNTIPPRPRTATEKPTAEFSWHDAEYPRVDPGIYEAVCKAVLGPVWIRMSFGRWGLRIVFVLLDDLGEVCLFLNMGTDRETPRIARNSAYREWWTAANGALPCHGEAMTPDVFMQDQIYRIKVADALMDAPKQPKTAAEIYSKVMVWLTSG